jgi:Holliday junction resolvasome RuvABC endonuclease subunit
MRILGLDISTTTIGRSVIDFNDKGRAKIIHLDYYKPLKGTLEDKEKDYLHMISDAKADVNSLINRFEPTHVAVEDYIRFMKGSSGAATIIPLATLNRTICLSVFENYPDLPLHICNIISIRTRIKKASNLTDLPKKEDLPELLEKLLKIKIPRPMKKTRKGDKLMEEHFDMTDAVAVAFYCNYLLTEKK